MEFVRGPLLAASPIERLYDASAPALFQDPMRSAVLRRRSAWQRSSAASRTIFMKFRLASILALTVAIAGCAAHQHSVVSISAPNSTKSVAAQHQNSGWYLMQPPVRHGDPNSHAQLADWQSIAFFDRASQCDAARERGLTAYGSDVPVSSTSTLDSVRLSQRLASSSLCVSADDPRINWFHIVWK